MEAYRKYDVVVIGGGLYGCIIALELKKCFSSVLILEKEADIMQRASYINQARVHNGYHYPRSLLTAWRSHINFLRFIDNYRDCIISDFDNYYAIAKKFSKVNTNQFKIFCDRIGVKLEVASNSVKKLFNSSLIEEVFWTEEYVFDSVKLKHKIASLLEEKKIEIKKQSSACKITKGVGFPEEIEIICLSRNFDPSVLSKVETYTIKTSYIFNCTYSAINTILSASNLSTIPLKHEFTEMALIEAPDAIQNCGITVMCGPFFSLMPFPSLGLHTFSHVRYTPHFHWQDSEENSQDTDRIYSQSLRKTNYPYMIRDGERYLPILKDCSYIKSLWEVKTVLPQSEIDDSRPILFQKNQHFPNLISILGGKIDNVYDITNELQLFFQPGSKT